MLFGIVSVSVRPGIDLLSGGCIKRMNTNTIADIRAYHEQWRILAFTFCDCFLGDRQKATTAAQDAFAAFLAESSELHNSPAPLRLLQYAIGSALDQAPQEDAFAAKNELERTLPELPAAERVVFILLGILELSPFEVATVGRTTSDEVHRLWNNSLLRLRRLWGSGS